MAHAWSNRFLDPIELASLYEWLDRVPLSRNRVQVEKDFADGLLAAEIIRHYIPSLVDMKSLRTAKNLNERQMQWQYLNTHLFSKIGLLTPPHVITQLCISKTGVAQQFLYNLRAILTLNGANTGVMPVPVYTEQGPPIVMRQPGPVMQNSYEEQAQWYQNNGRQNLLREHLPLANVYKDEYDYYWQKKQTERVVKSDKTKQLPKTQQPKSFSLPLLKHPPQIMAGPVNGPQYMLAGPPIHHVGLAAAKLQLDEKTSQIIEKDDEVHYLKGQLKRMEVLLQSKNAKIQELLDMLEREKKDKDRQRKPFVNF